MNLWLMVFMYLFSLPAIGNSGESHAIYISVIEIEHAGSENVAEMRVKVFRDDFVNAISGVSGKFEDIKTNADCTRKKDEIIKYMNRHLQCKINNKSLTLVLTNCDVQPEAVRLSFEMQCPERWESFSLHADYFTELFPDQMHMIMLESNGRKWSFRLDAGQKERQLVLN